MSKGLGSIAWPAISQHVYLIEHLKGKNTLSTYKNLVKKKRGNIFQQDEDVDFTLNNIIANNDYLMIKGSNATNLNNLSKRMIKGI